MYIGSSFPLGGCLSRGVAVSVCIALSSAGARLASVEFILEIRVVYLVLKKSTIMKLKTV